MTIPPSYYAQRKGAQPEALSYDQLQRLVAATYVEFDDLGWFQERMGKDCVDERRDIGAYVMVQLGRDLWPFRTKITEVGEDWLFSIIEFLYRHSAKPIETWNHPWDDCGLHVLKADDQTGRQQFAARINSILRRFEKPYELQTNGEIWRVAPPGLEAIEPTATGDASIDSRVGSAISAFRRHGASEDDKRHAIRDLADVLENLRASIGTGLPKKDEDDLFIIANKFGIRHHNPQQKTEYSKGIWLDWIFYAFLNSVALITHLIQRQASASSP